MIIYGHLPKQVKDIKIEDLLGRKPIELNNEQIKDNIKDKVVLISEQPDQLK